MICESTDVWLRGPEGTPPQDQLGHAVPSPPPQIRVSTEVGEVVSDDGATNLRWQQAGIRAGTKI